MIYKILLVLLFFNLDIDKIINNILYYSLWIGYFSISVIWLIYLIHAILIQLVGKTVLELGILILIVVINVLRKGAINDIFNNNIYTINYSIRFRLFCNTFTKSINYIIIIIGYKHGI